MDLLVAVDGSEESDRALSYAIDIAEAAGGSITLIHAIEPDVYTASGGEPISQSERRNRLIIEGVEAAEEHGEEILADATERAAAQGHDVTSELRYGEPVETITDFAEEGGFDTIYVGHRGRSERAIGILGSVARNVVERATVPVTVVREP